MMGYKLTHVVNIENPSRNTLRILSEPGPRALIVIHSDGVNIVDDLTIEEAKYVIRLLAEYVPRTTSNV